MTAVDNHIPLIHNLLTAVDNHIPLIHNLLTAVDKCNLNARRKSGASPGISVAVRRFPLSRSLCAQSLLIITFVPILTYTLMCLRVSWATVFVVSIAGLTLRKTIRMFGRGVTLAAPVVVVVSLSFSMKSRSGSTNSPVLLRPSVGFFRGFGIRLNAVKMYSWWSSERNISPNPCVSWYPVGYGLKTSPSGVSRISAFVFHSAAGWSCAMSLTVSVTLFSLLNFPARLGGASITILRNCYPGLCVCLMRFRPMSRLLARFPFRRLWHGCLLPFPPLLGAFDWFRSISRLLAPSPFADSGMAVRCRFRPCSVRSIGSPPPPHVRISPSKLRPSLTPLKPSLTKTVAIPQRWPAVRHCEARLLEKLWVFTSPGSRTPPSLGVTL